VLRVKVCVWVFTVAMAAAFLPGCYRMPINQGNRLEQTAVKRLQPGMTREQVRYLMGEPVLQEPFDQSRWNYVSRYKTRAGDYTNVRIILQFKGDTLVSIAGGNDVPSVEERDDASEDIQPE
jgi:outer membrane protein assembly factor BamE